MNYIGRQNKLLKILAEESLDAVIVAKKQNISYLVGADGEDSVLFISRKNNILITDARFKETCAKSLKNCSLNIINGKIYETIKNICACAHSKRIGFEAGHITYSQYINLKKALKDITLIPLQETVERLRMIKDKDEIACIKNACKDGVYMMNYAVKITAPGIKESCIKNKIEAYAIKKGIKKADFDIIVASGKNASMPHAGISDRKIKKEDMALIDLGAAYNGYNSDLTRTVFFGRINHKCSHIYSIVSDAQKKAIEQIKPGVRAKDIDTISRKYISNKGMGRYFIHSLGHGIGREIHEAPRISQNTSIRLEENMVITIEPGIYIPGWGGVRIEDTVLVTEKNCEVLTKEAYKKICR